MIKKPYQFPFIEDRYLEIKLNPFFLVELETITDKTTKGLEYYKHIIENVDINKNNPNNSYIMWACGKVDKLDKSKSCKIVEARTSLPDIDTDFPPFFRESVVKHIVKEHGAENVSQICTFGKLKGKGAIKEVARVTEICSFEEANEITECLPEESKIQDDMIEKEEESIILYTLKYLPSLLDNYVKLEDGVIVGGYSELFNLAIELEGTIKSIGRHAAGLVVSRVPIADICPVIKVGDDYVAGFDKKDVEQIGLVKFDILGVSALEKLMGINELLRYGKFVDDKIGHYENL